MHSIRRAGEIIMKRSHRIRAKINRRNSTSLLYTPELNRTVAIMPCLLSSVGSGYSVIKNRKTYLYSSFWSIHAYISHIVVGVICQEDYDWMVHKSKLPFYEVILRKFIFISNMYKFLIVKSRLL